MNSCILVDVKRQVNTTSVFMIIVFIIEFGVSIWIPRIGK
jgi:hypothetical protein